MIETIESRFQAAIDQGKINGAIICATDARADFVFNVALGERTLLSGERQALQLDDVCFLASATKLVTSIAALQCVDDGLIALDEDVSRVVPELGGKQVLTGFVEDDVERPVLEAAARPVTLELLLTHSAGTSYHFFAPLVGKWYGRYSPADFGRRKTVEEMCVYPLAYQPGSSWMYGPALDWAGRIVERLTGHSLSEQVRTRILAPVGARDEDAQFYPVTRPDLRSRLIDLNPDDPDGTGRAVVGGSADMNSRGKGDFGGHGLFMPATSYVKILHSLLANDGRMLRQDTVDDMFRDHLSPEAAAGREAALNGPIGPFFRVGIDAATRTGHGLGGAVTLEDVEGWYGANTLTWGGGLTMAWFVDRNNDLCGVCAIQATLPVDGDFIAELKQVFRKDIYRKRAAAATQT